MPTPATNRIQWPHLAGFVGPQAGHFGGDGGRHGGRLGGAGVANGLGDFVAGFKRDHAVGRREFVVVFGRVKLAEDAGPRRAVGFLHVAKVERAERRPEGHQADEHAEVADTVHDECLVGGRAGAVPFDVEADQEVRANADQLPKHERHREVAGEADAEHRERKQRQVLEEAVESAAAVQVLAVCQFYLVVGVVVQLIVHVAEGVNMHARGDQRHHAKHDEGERIDVVADREREFAEDAQGIPIAGNVVGRAVVVLGCVARFAGVFRGLHHGEVKGRFVGGRLLGVLNFFVVAGRELVRGQPVAEKRHAAQQKTGDDRGNRNVGRVLLRAVADADAEELRYRVADRNDGERRQRQQPGDQQ